MQHLIHQKILFGEYGGKIITIGILISVYGTINGYTMTGMRVPYAMAERKLLPFSHLFAKLTKSGAPWFGAIIQLIIAIIMMSMGAFDTITNMLIFCNLVILLYVFCCSNHFKKTRTKYGTTV